MADAAKQNTIPELTPAQAELRRLIVEVSTNPALVQFPADQWGSTTELKKAVLKAASGVRGQKDKQETLLATLAVLTAHVKARFDGDVKARAEYFDQVRKNEAARQHLETTTGRTANTAATVAA